MPAQFLVVGGGIGGLAAALALGRRGHGIELFEKASAFLEIGAGIQLGPNITWRLRALGVGDALNSVAVCPEALVVRNAKDGAELARMRLAGAFERRYGGTYVCIHRADLHALLLHAVSELENVQLTTGSRVTEVSMRDDGACIVIDGKRVMEGHGLIGADGIWGTVRAAVVKDERRPRYTGHTAWRAIAPMRSLPVALRSNCVQTWLGSRLHAVAYPVRSGELMNMVVIAETPFIHDARSWDQTASLAGMRRAIGNQCAAVLPLIEAMPAWRTWALNGRAPVAGPQEMASERIALVGDAAHPMVPYLAQGAGMAIEDASALAEAMGHGASSDVPSAFARYAETRWKRNAQVQMRAWRNGTIFHATGSVRMGRDLALRMLGERLLDLPWLYSG